MNKILLILTLTLILILFLMNVGAYKIFLYSETVNQKITTQHLALLNMAEKNLKSKGVDKGMEDLKGAILFIDASATVQNENIENTTYFSFLRESLYSALYGIP